jgi:ketosteroid isomerase-like protein
MKKTLSALVGFTLLLSVIAYGANKKSDEDERKAIARAEADFQKEMAEHGLEGWLSFFADNAADFTRGEPFSFTKDEMRKRLAKTFDPADQLTWKAAKIEVARSGDLAYSLGTWHLKGKNPKGEEVEQTGKYLTVWKKQTDGSWKVVADTGNVDPPAKKAQ